MCNESKARESLRHAQTFLGDATAQLSLAGLDDCQAEASRLYDVVKELDLRVQAAARSCQEAVMD